MWVELTDGRTIGVPLVWSPRLLNLTEEERQRVELSRLGLHWEHLDEDISVAGLLACRGDMTCDARTDAKYTCRGVRGTEYTPVGACHRAGPRPNPVGRPDDKLKRIPPSRCGKSRNTLRYCALPPSFGPDVIA